MSTIPAVSTNPAPVSNPVTTASTPPPPPPPVATDTASSAVTAPVDTVSISPEGYVLMEEFVETPADQLLVDTGPQVTIETISVSQTFSSGTTVSVYSEIYKLPDEIDMRKNDANELILRLLPDPKVMAKVDKEDGTSETFEITADTIFSEDENGNLVIRQNFTQSDDNGNQVMNGSDGNDLIVSLTDNNIINSGEGDDTIFLFSNKNTVSLGDGNNTVSGYGHMSEGNTITGGNGNNSVERVEGKIILGDGNNTIKDTNSYINLGDGNNTIDGVGGKIIELGSSVFATGNGVVVGNGNNNINIESTLGVTAGNGNNTINIGYLSNFGGTMKIGDGNNDINVGYIGLGTKVAVGDGSNSVNMGRITSDAAVAIGGGNNLINIDSYEQPATVSIGGGNNVMTIDKIYHIGSDKEVSKGYSGRGMGVLLAHTSSAGGISIGRNTKVLVNGMDVGDDIREAKIDFFQLDRKIMENVQKEEEQRTTDKEILEMYTKRILEVQSLQKLITSNTLDANGREEVKNRLLELKEEGEAFLQHFTREDGINYNGAIETGIRILEELGLS